MNRRHFLKAGLASSVLFGSSPLASAQRLQRRGSRPSGSAKNIIFLVADGMSAGTLAITDQFLRWRDGRPSTWIRLHEEQRGSRGLMDVASLNSIVPDSAAAAVAWGCGQRVNNGSVNTGPNGEEHPPILLLAREAGKAAGLVTTATVSHATPAAFAANVANRNMEQEIARQYLDREYDVILGGGRHFFSASKRDDGRDLVKEFQEKGYQLVETRQELTAARPGHGPLLGLFEQSYLPYELDRLNDEALRERTPTLAEMTRAALDHLSRNRKGFVVQIEGARVDMAAHSNDIGGLVFDQIAFDEAIQVAVEFSEKNPETLVIVTTDHGNANPGLNSGNEGGEQNFRRLAKFRGTHGAILSRVNAESTVEEIRAAMEEVTALSIAPAHLEMLQGSLRGTYNVPYGRLNRPSSVLAQVIANHTDIGWTGTTHTSDYVEVLAWGPGSEKIKPFNRNTDLFDIMVESAGIPTGARV